MQTIRYTAQGLALAVMLSLPITAWADGTFYGGAGIGLAKTGIDKNALPIGGATATTLSRSDADPSGKVFAGFQITPAFAVEAGYVDLGTTSATRTMTAPLAGTASVSAKNTGWFIDLVGMMPMGVSNTSVIGRVGRVSSLTTKSLSTTGAVAPLAGIDPNPREREANWKFGAGAQYDFGKTMAARAEWERYTRLGSDIGTGTSIADMFSLNLLIRFK